MPIRTLKATETIEGSSEAARAVWALGVLAKCGYTDATPKQIAECINSNTHIEWTAGRVSRFFRRAQWRDDLWRLFSRTSLTLDARRHVFSLAQAGSALFYSRWVEGAEASSAQQVKEQLQRETVKRMSQADVWKALCGPLAGDVVRNVIRELTRVAPDAFAAACAVAGNNLDGLLRLPGAEQRLGADAQTSVARLREIMARMVELRAVLGGAQQGPSGSTNSSL